MILPKQSLISDLLRACWSMQSPFFQLSPAINRPISPQTDGTHGGSKPAFVSQRRTDRFWRRGFELWFLSLSGHS